MIIKPFHNSIIAVIIMGVFAIAPFRAQAVWGAGDVSIDPANLGTNIEQVVTDVEQVVNMVQMVLKEFGLDTIIYKASQKASQKIIAKVLNNTNGGSSGDDEPLFVGNFQDYFRNIHDKSVNVYGNYLMSQSDNPFAQSVGAAIIRDNAEGGNPLSQFTLKDFDNWEGAIDSIDAVGSRGWDFYSQLAFPQNSPVGSSMLAQQQLAAKIKNEKEVARTELLSSGALPDKGKCTSSPDLQGYSQQTIPAGTPTTPTVLTNQPANTNPGGYAGPAGGPNGEGAETHEPVTGSQTFTIGNDCFKAQIKTPRFTNESAVNQATIESFERLRNSDEIGKFLSNTISGLIQGLIQKGLSSLNSDGGQSTAFYGGPKDARTIAVGQSWANNPEQIIDLQHELIPAIDKTTLEIEYANQLLDAIRLPISGELGTDNAATPVDERRNVAVRLEACLPGPDTGWDQKLLDYVIDQAQETQERASSSENDDRASFNSVAYSIVRRQSDQAAQEEKQLMSIPFLNIPAATEMQSVVDEYYKTAQAFRGTFDKTLIKRQVLSRLQTIKAEVTAYAPKYPLGCTQGTAGCRNLVLFVDQWNALTTPEKNALYNSFDATAVSEFPEYADTTDPTKLSALPADVPTTPIDEHDEAMKQRTLDLSWGVWETEVEDANKNNIYAKFDSMTRDISDSGTVQNMKISAEGALTQMNEMWNVLSDCEAIRVYVSQPGANANDELFKAFLKSDRIKNAFSGPSILNAAQNNVDFADLNKRLVNETINLQDYGWYADNGGAYISSTYGGQLISSDPTNTLQVNIPTTPQAIINQDIEQKLFCRLTNYMLYYWTPTVTGKALTGKPIGCGPGDGIHGIRADGTQNTSTKELNPSWYHTNAAEILFNINEG